MTGKPCGSYSCLYMRWSRGRTRTVSGCIGWKHCWSNTGMVRWVQRRYVRRDCAGTGGGLPRGGGTGCLTGKHGRSKCRYMRRSRGRTSTVSGCIGRNHCGSNTGMAGGVQGRYVRRKGTGMPTGGGLPRRKRAGTGCGHLCRCRCGCGRGCNRRLGRGLGRRWQVPHNLRNGLHPDIIGLDRIEEYIVVGQEGTVDTPVNVMRGRSFVVLVRVLQFHKASLGHSHDIILRAGGGAQVNGHNGRREIAIGGCIIGHNRERFLANDERCIVGTRNGKLSLQINVKGWNKNLIACTGLVKE